LAATIEIAERRKFDLPIGKPQMPVVPVKGQKRFMATSRL